MNSRRVTEYSVASTKEAAFVFGGSNGRGSNSPDPTIYDLIAKFENYEWSRFGSLQQSRFYHGSITSGSKTMIFGGYGGPIKNPYA